MRSSAAAPIEHAPARMRLPERPAVTRPPASPPALAGHHGGPQGHTWSASLVGDDPSIGEALAEVAAAGHDLAVDRFELLKLELLDGLKAQMVRAAQLAGAAILLFLGWLFLMAAAVSGLALVIGVPLALLAVGAPHVLVGVALVQRAGRDA